jgi:flagellar protein FliS
MSYATKTTSYRDLEVLSASPEKLVLMLYDHLLSQFERARIGFERDTPELSLGACTKIRTIVGELLATLDFERGGEIAEQLAALYQFLLLQLLDVRGRDDLQRLQRLHGIVATLRDGFVGAADQLVTVRLSA